MHQIGSLCGIPFFHVYCNPAAITFFKKLCDKGFLNTSTITLIIWLRVYYVSSHLIIWYTPVV